MEGKTILYQGIKYDVIRVFGNKTITIISRKSEIWGVRLLEIIYDKVDGQIEIDDKVLSGLEIEIAVNGLKVVLQ